VRIVTPQQIRQIDNIAIGIYGIASVTLMENAGSVVADVVRETLSHKRDEKICVLCGKGNNGGDGLVTGRQLLKSRFKTDTFLLAKPQELASDARFNLELMKSENYKVNAITNSNEFNRFIKNFKYSIVVDAILGTGYSGASISEPLKSVISFVNKTMAKIISIDIPSGLNGLSGKVRNAAVKSTITVTLGLAKRGFYLNAGPAHSGRVIVRNIGFPRELLNSKTI